MPAAIAVERLWKYFGDFAALSDISFSVQAGECVALLGRNGAGKTTLLRILAGLSRGAEGRVFLHGSDPRTYEARVRTGILGHGIAVYDELSAFENLRVFGRLYGLAKPESAAEEWLDRTGLGHARNGLVREFSRGMRQRLAVARACLHDPDILILDEPFTALDDRAIAVLQTVLRDASQTGRTIVMSTHQLREALELATTVVLLQRGKLVFHGPRTPEMAADTGYVYRTYGEA